MVAHGDYIGTIVRHYGFEGVGVIVATKRERTHLSMPKLDLILIVLIDNIIFKDWWFYFRDVNGEKLQYNNSDYTT